MAPSGLQAHNQNHAGLPPGINPQVRPQCSPRWGRFLRSGDLRVTEGIFQERTSKNRERLKAERLAREAAGGSHRRHSGSERVIAKGPKETAPVRGRAGAARCVGAEKQVRHIHLVARRSVPGDSLIRVTPFRQSRLPAHRRRVGVEQIG